MSETCTPCNSDLRVDGEAPAPGKVGEYCVLPSEAVAGSLEVRNGVGSWTVADQSQGFEGTLRVHADRLTFTSTANAKPAVDIEPISFRYKVANDDGGETFVGKTLFLNKV